MWWTFTRPDIRVFTGPPGRWRWLGVAAIRRGRRRRAALVAAGVLALAVAWCTAVGPATARTYLRYTAVGADEGFMYQLRLQVLPDPAIKAGLPAAAGHAGLPGRRRRRRRQPAWRINDFAAAYRSCPDLRRLGRRTPDTAMFEFAKAAPATYAADDRRSCSDRR